MCVAKWQIKEQQWHLALLFWQLVIRNFRELPYARIPRTRILPRIAMPMDLIEHEQTYR
jgi:hypothetical protein